MTDEVTYHGGIVCRAPMAAISALKVDLLRSKLMFGRAVREITRFKILTHFQKSTFRWNAKPGDG